MRHILETNQHYGMHHVLVTKQHYALYSSN